ncbi:MAG: hypothetical protein LRY73_13555 [Bacillus sp. (in: Bacteria)]|nr:hypothetical protein [Bacillus sp. (in: firmicutes)]
MKQLKLFSLVLVLFMSLLPLNSFAEEDIEKKEEVENHEVGLTHKNSVLKTHIKFYYELLIEKYRPDIMEEWKEISREKDAILKKLKELKKEGKEFNEPIVSEEWKEKHCIYHEQFLAAVEKKR